MTTRNTCLFTLALALAGAGVAPACGSSHDEATGGSGSSATGGGGGASGAEQAGASGEAGATSAAGATGVDPGSTEPGEPRWTGTIRANLDVLDYVLDVAVDPFGNTLLLGGGNDGMGVAREAILKFDADGRLVFSHALPTFDDRQLLAAGLVVDEKGNFCFAGHQFPNGTSTGRGVLVACYAPDGQEAFSTWLFGDGSESALSIAADAAGNLYVGGLARVTLPREVTPEGTGSHGFVAKLDSRGRLNWTARLEGSTLAVDADGDVYVGTDATGSSELAADASLTKLAPDGATLWETALGDSGMLGELGFDSLSAARVAVSRDGETIYFVANASSSDCSVQCASQAIVGKFDPDGNLGGSFAPSGDGAELGLTLADLAVGADGSELYLLTDLSYLARYGDGGDEQWHLQDPIDAEAPRSFTAFALDAAGDIVLAGGNVVASPSAKNQSDFTLVRVRSSDGSEL